MDKSPTKFEIFFKNRGEFLDLELTLKRIDKALVAVGVAFDNFKVIHIAGTNGKGSTSLFIAQMLQEKGYNTLLFTSPHIIDITERIIYNLKPITANEFDELFEQVRPIIIQESLSYFESLFLIYMAFAMSNNVQYLVIETGLGGRFDATNTSLIKKKTPVITTMGQDHELLLGKNIYSIIDEKIAITRGNSPVFVGINTKSVTDYISKKLPKSEIVFATVNQTNSNSDLYPYPFSINWLNAVNVVRYITGEGVSADRLSLPPCRQEIIGRLMLDGAHNMSALIALFKGIDISPSAVIFSATSERNFTRMIDYISQYTKNIIITTIPNNERSLDLKKIGKIDNAIFIEDPITALDLTLSQNEGRVLVTGSLYLCAYVRRHILDKGIYA